VCFVICGTSVPRLTTGVNTCNIVSMMCIRHDSGNGLERHFCVKDAAKRANMSRAWLHKLIADGRVSAPYTRLGRRWVSESEIERVKMPEVERA